MYEQIKEYIRNNIASNGTQSITGDLLQNVLIEMTDSLGGATFAGIANPQYMVRQYNVPVFFLAVEGGNYTGFGNNVSLEDGLGIIHNISGDWTAVQLLIEEESGEDIQPEPPTPDNPDSSEIIPIDYKDYTSDPEYPEYLDYNGGAKGDGIAYYDWPLVCYNGESPTNIVIEQGVANAEVSAPSEHIVSKMGLEMPYTSKDVYYNANLGLFLLKIGNSYYKEWLNSYYWNNHDSNEARTDTVFSDVSIDSQTNMPKRGAYIFDSDSNSLVDIKTTMTDDTNAILSCLTEQSTSGKVVRLRRGKVYFLGSISGPTFFSLVSNMTIEGNDATLFVRKSENSGTATILRIQSVNNITINNLKIKALKDRDGVAPESNTLLSSSSSTITGVTTYGSANNIHINNIEFKNIYQDFDLRTGSKIFIDGWKSVGVKNNSLDTTKTYIRNADLTTAEYTGCGPHLFYGGRGTDEVYFQNCKFKAADGYQEVLISFHASAGDMPPEGTQRNVYFDNCLIEAGAMFKGNGYGTNGRQWIHFKNCVLRKTFETVADSGEQLINRRDSLGWLDTNSWDFEDCIIEIGYGYFMTQGRTGSQYNLVIKNTSIYSKLASASDNLIKNFGGSVDTKNIWTNYPGPMGINIDNDSMQNIINSLQNDLRYLKSSVMGQTVPIYDSAPTSPNLGDKYYNSVDNKVYVCTNVGKSTRISINYNYAMNGAPYTLKQTLVFDDDEQIEFDFNNVSSLEELKEVFIQTLEDAGYTSGPIKGSTWSNGIYNIYDSGSIHRLLVTSKKNGDFVNLHVTDPSDNNPFKSLYSSWGTTYNYQLGHGQAPTWEESDSGGLVSDVSKLNLSVADLINRVTALENAGSGADDGTVSNGDGSGTGAEPVGEPVG